MVDAAGRVRFYNQRMLELLNLPESVLLGQPTHESSRSGFRWSGVTLGSSSNCCQRRRGPTSRGRRRCAPARYVRRTPEGVMLEVLTRQLPDGGFVRTYTDVTSYVDAQEALREERQRLQWVLEATRPGIWEYNLETQECPITASGGQRCWAIP